MAPRKRALFAGLHGRVVEIGPGAGVNLDYLPRDVEYIAVEPNEYMHRYLMRAARGHGIEVDLRPAPVETAHLDEESADAVICTLVLCSVDDPAKVVAGVKRLLRPGGRFIFVEHVAAPRGTWLRTLQRMVGPAWRILGDGCHPDRETWGVLERAGFDGLTYERFRAPLPIVSPHIAGIGVRR